MILFAQDALVLRWDESDNDQGGHEDNLVKISNQNFLY